MPAASRRRPQATAGPIEAAAALSRSGVRQDQPMTELTDVSGAFGYGDSILDHEWTARRSSGR